MHGRVTPMLLVAALLLLGGAEAWAQASDDVPQPRSPISVFIGAGQNSLSGGASRGGSFGVGAAGFAYELPHAGPGAWRAELLTARGVADFGRTGLFSQPTFVSAIHVGFGAGYRRYTTRHRYFGAGAALVAVTQCDVDFEGGPSFLGGETESCLLSGLGLQSKSAIAAINVSAGLRGGRFDYELRLDQGLNASVESSEGGMRLRTLGLVVQYRFRSRR